jgi:hypothetical protein
MQQGSVSYYGWEIYNVPLLKQIALAVGITKIMQRHYLSLLPGPCPIRGSAKL